jgi:tRNA A-37 threonylcarbamoyl transferase component Bud32
MYHTEPIALVPLGSLGGRLCSREVYYFAKMTGIPGLPRVLAQHGESGYIREYVPGCDLREYRKTHGPNELFYAKLKVLLASIHAQGISHNDLSKPENNPRSTRRHAGDYRLPDRGRLLVALAHFETARPSGP